MILLWSCFHNTSKIDFMRCKYVGYDRKAFMRLVQYVNLFDQYNIYWAQQCRMNTKYSKDKRQNGQQLYKGCLPPEQVGFFHMDRKSIIYRYVWLLRLCYQALSITVNDFGLIFLHKQLPKESS